MIRNLISLGFMAAIAVQALPVDYTITGNLPGHDGQKFYVIDYDTWETVDSAIVTDGRLLVKGTYDRPAFVRVECGNTFANCVLDTLAELDFDIHYPAGGSLLNRRLRDFEQKDNEMLDGLSAIQDKGKHKVGYDELIKFYTDVIMENDNGVGYCVFKAFATNAKYGNPELWATYYPHFPPGIKASRYATMLNEYFSNRHETEVGMHFIDFEGETPDGNPVKFSDYIGKGKYVLVDFWASWCTPCRQEAQETLIPLYEKYKDSADFEILGVAVCENPADTKKFLETANYSWRQIIDAGEVPMERYSFTHVPMIMLFSPDGTILALNIRGEEITDAVEKCLQGKPKEGGK